MPRDGADIYHIPPGTQGAPNTTIESAKYNAYCADVEQDLNLPRPIVAGGTGANNATTARTNMQAERAMQTVTNFDTHTWEVGSFYAASTATAPPGALAHRFAGIVYGPDTSNLVIEARDLDDTSTPGLVWVREKAAGVWGAWTSELTGYSTQFVLKAGDTMTGNLNIVPPTGNSRIILEHVAGSNSQILGRLGSLSRWQLQLGTNEAESTGNAGTNFSLASFNDAGGLIGNALVINRATMAATFGGALSVTGGAFFTAATFTGDILQQKAAPTINFNDTGAGSVVNLSVARNGSLRWQTRMLDGSAESGANAGSNFTILRFNDAGGWFGDAPFAISRATGIVSGNGAAPVNGPDFVNKTYADLKLALTGGTLTGNLTIGQASPTFTLNTLAGEGQISNQRSGVMRWRMIIGDAVAESGSNAGSNFNLINYNDAGSAIGNAMYITRANGNCVHSGYVDAAGLVMGRPGIGAAPSGFQYSLVWTGSVLQAWVQGSNVGNVTLTSDYRVKENVADLASMWDVVKALRPVSYNFNNWTPDWELDAQKNKAAELGEQAAKPFAVRDPRERWGFIAHELQETLLETAATGFKDAPKIVQSPDPMTILAALTKAVQELMARVEALEAAAVP